MKVLVCGSRKWSDWPRLRDRLAQIDPVDLHIIEGGAPGADVQARQYAVGHKCTYTEVPALWRVHGKAAGPIRNRQMLDMKPDMVIAFHEDYEGSKGTKDCVEEAKRRGIPVEIVTPRLLSSVSRSGEGRV